MAGFLDFGDLVQSLVKDIQTAVDSNKGSSNKSSGSSRSDGPKFLPPAPKVQQPKPQEDEKWWQKFGLASDADKAKYKEQSERRQQQTDEYARGLTERRTPKVDAKLKDTYSQKPVLTQQQQAEKDIRDKKAADEKAAEQLKQRDRALGRTPGVEFEPVDPNDEDKLYQMSDSDYYGLNDISQDAVNSNTLIAEALRSKDVTGELQARLKQLGLPTTKNRLDEYTSLKATVDDKDLKGPKAILSNEALGKSATAAFELGLSAMAPIQSMARRPNLDITLGNPRFGVVTRLAVAGQELEKKLAENSGGWLAAGFDVAAAKDRGETPDLPYGFGDTPIELLYKDLFASVAGIPGATKKRDEVLEDLKANPDAYAEFLDYAKIRNQNSEASDLNYGTEDGVLTPEQVAKMLGLDKRGEK